MIHLCPLQLFSCLSVVNNAAVDMGVLYLFKSVFSFSSNKYPEVELLDHMVVLVLVFIGAFHTVFYNDCTNLYSYLQCTRVLFSPHSHPTFSPTFVNLLGFLIIARCEMIPHCGFDLHFPDVIYFEL